MTNTKSARKLAAIDIPVTGVADQRLIAGANSAIQSALTKNRVVRLDGYAIPEKDGDLFRRQITIMKKVRDTGAPAMDLPDLEDVQKTDLPWIGEVSFKSASRQFRAKNAFSAMVQVVRQYGDYLYLLTDEASSSNWVSSADELVPTLFNVVEPTSRNAYWNVSRQGPMLASEIETVPAMPVPLIMDMMAIGYGVIDCLTGAKAGTSAFVYPDTEEGLGHRLHCRLYGRLQIVKDTSVCLVSQ